MHFVLLLLMTAAAPPSSSLTGADGTLSWSVRADGDRLLVDGRSPKWTVRHVARRDLQPIRTERTADGHTVTVAYSDSGAVVTLPNKTVTVERAGLWDSETVDVRLGSLVAAGTKTADFAAVDFGNGKVYEFQARLVGEETCGGDPCSHMRVTLAGLLKPVGPKWHFWFGIDGRLLRFDGPLGKFEAEG